MVIGRFRVPDDRAEAFARDARAALQVLGERDGFIDGAIGQATDDPELRVLTTRWSGVGAYRRALSSLDVKMTAIPFLSMAIDEPSAFEIVHGRDASGTHDAVSALAADAGSTRLGEAAGPSVPPVIA